MRKLETIEHRLYTNFGSLELWKAAGYKGGAKDFVFFDSFKAHPSEQEVVVLLDTLLVACVGAWSHVGGTTA